MNVQREHGHQDPQFRSIAPGPSQSEDQSWLEDGRRHYAREAWRGFETPLPTKDGPWKGVPAHRCQHP